MAVFSVRFHSQTMELRFEDLAALEALGVLEGDDARRFHELLNDGGGDAYVESRAFQDVLTGMAIALPPVEPPPAIRQKLMETIRQTPQNVPGQSRTVRQSDGRWVDLPTPGARIKTLSFDRARNTVTMLLHLDPQTALPEHDHRGAEESFVISGSCRIGNLALRAGDFHRAEGATHHGQVISDEGCLLLLVIDASDSCAA